MSFTKPSKMKAVTPLSVMAVHLQKAILKYKKGEDMSGLLEQTYQLSLGIEEYIKKYSSSDSKALKSILNSTMKTNWTRYYTLGLSPNHLEKEMLSGHPQGQFLKMLTQVCQAENGLDIGMFTGYSALAMAEALPAKGKVMACEKDQMAMDVAKACFHLSPAGKKIQIQKGPIIKTLNRLAKNAKSFDMIFMDADKKEYCDYYSIIMDKQLLNPKGILCVDNTMLQGLPLLPTNLQTENSLAISKFNELVKKDDRVNQVMIPLRDGMTLITHKKILIHRSGVNISK